MIPKYTIMIRYWLISISSNLWCGDVSAATKEAERSASQEGNISTQDYQIFEFRIS